MMFLVLEDEPFIAMDLSMAFEDAGHEAATAATCEEAMDVLANRHIAGAVLDVNLGGGQTCEKAAAELDKRGLPFVLHTGDLNRVGELLRDFGAPIIEKPVPSETVVARLLDLCEENASENT